MKTTRIVDGLAPRVQTSKLQETFGTQMFGLALVARDKISLDISA